MISCIIIDDEPHAIEVLERYVGQTPYLKLACSTTNPMEALQMVNTMEIDLAFLDIQIPDNSGI